MRSALRSLSVALAMLASMGGAALAQAPRCDAWRAELAQIDRSGSGDPRAERALRQVAGQLGQAQAAFQSMQCDGAWVFQQAPPQCGALRAQIGQLRAQYAAIQQQAGGGSDSRRRALIAALNEHCRVGVHRTDPMPPRPIPAQPQQPRSLFEALFGIQPDPEPQRGSEPEVDWEGEQREERQWGSGRPVCVRTCDGFFFPLGNSPGGRASQEEMCRALCPAAEVQVFFMQGDGNIENAVGRGGQRYMSLPNANRFTRQFDSACTCRKPGQSWASALAEAEEMIERRRGDILVNERRAEEMSRARLTPQQQRERDQLRLRQEAALRTEAAADAATQQALDAQGRAAPTASTETTGIAAGQVGAGFVGANQGERREMVTSGGERRTVRVVAPNLAPAIQ